MIIRGDDHQRHLLDGSDVHAFVERTGLHPALADAREADEILFAPKSFRH